MLVAVQLKRDFAAAALKIVDSILKSKFPLAVARRQLWQCSTMCLCPTATMACFETLYKAKGNEISGSLKLSLLLIRRDSQVAAVVSDDIKNWLVAGARLSGEIVERLEAPTELSRYQLHVLAKACEQWKELRPSAEPTKHFELFDQLCLEYATAPSKEFKKIAQFFPHQWRSE